MTGIPNDLSPEFGTADSATLSSRKIRLHSQTRSFCAVAQAGLGLCSRIPPPPPEKQKAKASENTFSVSSLVLALKARALVDVDQYFVFTDSTVSNNLPALGVRANFHQSPVLARPAPRARNPTVLHCYHFTTLFLHLQGFYLFSEKLVSYSSQKN